MPDVVAQEAAKQVDLCFEWGKSCGQPAAQAFCQRMGYGHATGFERADNVGAAGPTRTLGDGKLCEGPDCDGFARIT